MSTFYVKKDGSGTHDSIQSAIYDAQNGDVVNVGEGTWYENIELYKAVELIGAGKDVTFVQGQLTNQTFAGATFFQGEDVVTVPSTTNLIRGRRVTATNFAANSRVSEIISPTQFRVFPATTASTITKTAVSVVSGSSTITLPNTTSVVVGMKVTGLGVSGVITAINTTTKVITLNTPNTENGSNVLLTFRAARAVTVTMPSLFSGSTFPASIQVMNVALDGWKIKDMTITGFDNPNPATEVAAIGISSAAHANWIIDNCKVIADGDYALITSYNNPMLSGLVQNCIFDGKTFVGNNPATGNQFSVFNVPRQLVVLQTINGISFINNQVIGITGGLTVDGVESYNTAVTNDGNGAVITGNTFAGNFGTGYALRARGYEPVVSENTNNTNSPNSGFYVLPTHATGISYKIGDMVFVSSKYFECIEAHTSAVNTHPVTGVNTATYWEEVTIVEVNASGSYGVGVQELGSNVATFDALVSLLQEAAGSNVEVSLDVESLKALSKVSQNASFSNEEDWDMVSIVLKHSTSAKRLVSGMRNLSESKQVKLKPSMQSGDLFELHKIIIAKEGRVLLVLKRSDIDRVSSYKIVLK